LPTGADDSQAQYNDGRVGTAYIQEFRFNKYCERLQTLATSVFDEEFKLYLHNRGVNIDSSLFELKLQPPMNFAAYRQSEVDGQRINTFNTIQAVPFISKRFALKRFLGLSEEEMAENELLWSEEQGKSDPIPTDSSGELRSIGLSQGNIAADVDAALATGQYDLVTITHNETSAGVMNPIAEIAEVIKKYPDVRQSGYSVLDATIH
jgi:hypothetical protein